LPSSPKAFSPKSSKSTFFSSVHTARGRFHPKADEIPYSDDAFFRCAELVGVARASRSRMPSLVQRTERKLFSLLESEGAAARAGPVAALDAAEDVTPEASGSSGDEVGPDSPSQSAKLFRRFIRGYAGKAWAHQKKAAADDRALAELLEEMESVDGEGKGSKSPQESNHYDFFSRMPAEKAGNPEDHARRLDFRRRRLQQTRTILASKRLHRNRAKEAGIARSSIATRHASSFGGRSFGGLATANAAAEVELRMREACESLRFLVFGSNAMERVAGAIPDEASGEGRYGTKEEVMQLHKVWCQMDEDGSGDVEFHEFLSFFSKSKADRLLGMRCVNYLVGKARVDGIDERDAGCTIEDMMRLIWLKARDEDIEKMLYWFREAEFKREQVPTPPLLPKRKKRAILANFPGINWEDSNAVSFAELLATSLIDENTMREIRDHADVSSCGSLSQEALLEMNGYRAHRKVNTATDKQGRHIVYMSNEFFTGWVQAGTTMKSAEEEDERPPPQPPSERPEKQVLKKTATFGLTETV